MNCPKVAPLSWLMVSYWLFCMRGTCEPDAEGSDLCSHEPTQSWSLEQGEALFSYKAMTHHHIKQKGN